MQSITTAEAYVSRGAPSDKVLAPVGKGLEFQALTHPNRIAVGQQARFTVLLDGRPLAGKQIEVIRARR